MTFFTYIISKKKWKKVKLKKNGLLKYTKVELYLIITVIDWKYVIIRYFELISKKKWFGAFLFSPKIEKVIPFALSDSNIHLIQLI
jgi:hypothetical protein